MPRRYNSRLATKQYVNQRIEQEQWSRQYICTGDFDEGTSDYSIYDVTGYIMDQIIAENILIDAPTDNTTDDRAILSMVYKIDYIKLHFRVALGESESVSAVSQTVRMVLYRSDSTYEDFLTDGPQQIADDLDGSLKYDYMYGNKFGLYWDKTKYIHSWAVDNDTTAGGQVFFNKFVKPKITDTITANIAKGTGPTITDIDTEKGVVGLAVFSDDPDGTNAQIYGYVELGWRYKY